MGTTLKFRKTIFIFVIASISIATNAREKASSDRILKAGGWIEKLEEKSSFGKNCHSERKYFAIQDLPNVNAQNRINMNIRKQMTVGRKLTAKDCIGAETYPDGFNYYNLASIVSDDKIAIKVRFAVAFPGHGNLRVWCETYDFISGKKALEPKDSSCPEVPDL